MRYFKPFMLWLLGLFFVAGGANHFRDPDFYVKIMPPYLPWHLELVYLSGVAEFLLGFLVLIPKCRSLAAWGLIALLIAVFPANIHMAFDSGGLSSNSTRAALDPITFAVCADCLGVLVYGGEIKRTWLDLSRLCTARTELLVEPLPHGWRTISLHRGRDAGGKFRIIPINGQRRQGGAGHRVLAGNQADEEVIGRRQTKHGQGDQQRFPDVGRRPGQKSVRTASASGRRVSARANMAASCRVLCGARRYWATNGNDSANDRLKSDAKHSPMTSTSRSPVSTL